MNSSKAGNTSSPKSAAIDESNRAPRRKIGPNDLPLNVTLKEAMVRFGFVLLLPIAALFIDKHLIIYTAPVVIYLFITGITRYCIIKYLWRRVINHEPPIRSPQYGKDINYPDESVS
ncbi:MAG: hypothetical protein ACXVMS_11220 [Flavisolibacter sp.]